MRKKYMELSGYKLQIDEDLNDTLNKLGEILNKVGFEIISEDEVSDIADLNSVSQYVRVLCQCNSITSSKILSNEKAIYLPPISFIIEELNRHSTKVTVNDPQITLTPIQVKRLGQATVKLNEMLKNCINNL